MRFRLATVALLLGAAVAAGCSEEREVVPAACRQGPDALRAALRDAPRPVTLGGTRLSECVKETSGGGALQEGGAAYLPVAAALADAAARDPDGPEAVQLGYLMGTFERTRAGAQGVGYELGRRLRSEVSRVAVRSPAFVRGRRAGRRHG